MTVHPYSRETWFHRVGEFLDHHYRRMGLGRAAVLEGLRRCATEGATTGYVGSNLPFYLALGFTPLSVAERWIRRW